MEEYHLLKVEEYVHQKNEKEFFFLKKYKMVALTFRWKESQSINRKHPHQHFGCAIISTARRGGQKSYSAGLGSELLINYLGSCALFESMPTQMWSEISQLCLVTIDTQAAHTILSGRQCLACSLATLVCFEANRK